MKNTLLLALLLLVNSAWATISNVTETHTTTSITLSWVTDQREFNPQVKFSNGTACELTQTATGSSSCVMTQSVLISGLEANTTYCLRPQSQFCSGLSTDIGSSLTVTTNSSDTATVTISATASPTQTATKTATPTATRTITLSHTVSPTRTVSPTITLTRTASTTATRTTSVTQTLTVTRTVTATPTPISTFIAPRLVLDSVVLSYSGAGSYTVALRKQPIELLHVYFIDLTTPGIPNAAAVEVIVTAADYAFAVANASTRMIYSFDTSGNFLFTDNSASVLTSGHQYQVLVQYLITP